MNYDSGLWISRLKLLRELYGDGRLFSANDFGKLFKLGNAARTHALSNLRTRREIFRIATGNQMCHLTNGFCRHAWFSLDPSKTIDDVLDFFEEEFDPIPLEKRTLAIQLTGDELKRYLECRRNRLLAGYPDNPNYDPPPTN